MDVMKKLKISKSEFEKAISAVKKQRDSDRTFSECMESVFDGHPVYTGNDTLVNAFMDLLGVLCKDEDEWIDWWIWECDFGKGATMRLPGSDEDIHLKTAGDLYDLLSDNIK